MFKVFGKIEKDDNILPGLEIIFLLREVLCHCTVTCYPTYFVKYLLSFFIYAYEFVL